MSKNLPNEIWKFLDSNTCIRRNMQCGLINIRALARYIIREKKLDTTLDATIGAIRRYDPGKYDDVFNRAQKIIHQIINLSTRSNITVIFLVKDAVTQQKLSEIFNIIDYVKGDTLRISQANESVKVLIDTKNLEKIITLFPKEKILYIEKNLAEINMHLDPKMIKTPGILAVITTELATNGINIVEALTSPPEMLWFVKEEDLLKAYNVLYQLCNLKEKNDN